MLQINEKLFSKEVVKSFFDLKIKVKYAILRSKKLEPYIKTEKAKNYFFELKEFNKEIEDYMELYKERFHIIPYKNNLNESENKNSFLIEKYKREQKEIIEFENENNFPKGSYPLEFDLFVKDLFNDIQKLEKLKENQEKIIIEKI